MPGEFYIEGKQQKVDITQLVNAVTDLKQSIDSLVVFHGTTTAPGAPDGSTLICADLAAEPDFDGNLVVIRSGDFTGQSRQINGATTGGTVIPDHHFEGQIAAGVKFDVIAIRVGAADLTAILARLDDGTFGLAALKAQGSAIKSQTDKLAGAAPVSGSAAQNWTGESNVVSIGADGVRNKVQDLTLSIHNLVGNINVRMYKKVNGTERKCYDQPFNAATPGLPIVDGTWGIHGVLRVTLQSDNATDNGKAVDYDYMLEAM